MANWREAAGTWCCWAGGLALVAMMLLTVTDVILRAAINTPIRGAFEIVELLLAYGFFLALPAAFLRDDHIVVDIVDGIMPRAVPLLRRLSLVLGIALLGVMAWQGWLAARDAFAFNDITSDLGIPRIWYWAPVLAGLIGSSLAAIAMLWRKGSA